MQFNKLKRHELITLRGGAAPIIQKRLAFGREQRGSVTVADAGRALHQARSSSGPRKSFGAIWTNNGRPPDRIEESEEQEFQLRALRA